MHFHVMKNIFTVFLCMPADNSTSDSTAVTAEVAVSDLLEWLLC